MYALLRLLIAFLFLILVLYAANAPYHHNEQQYKNRYQYRVLRTLYFYPDLGLSSLVFGRRNNFKSLCCLIGSLVRFNGTIS